MKNIMMETAQVTCGLSKGPCRHKETWWRNQEIAEAVKEKKKKYGSWKRENLTAWKEYEKSRQNTKRFISSVKEKKQKECASNLNDPNHQNEIFRIAKQMVKERQDIMGSDCLKGVLGNVIVDKKGIKDCGRNTRKN